MLETLESLFGSWRHPVEVVVIAGLIYGFLRFLRGTRGEGILKGLSLLLFGTFAGLYGLASWLELPHIEAVLTVIVQTSVVAIIVIFQQELRQALTRLGQTPFGSGFGDRKVVEEVVNSVTYLSRKRIGALIAFERQQGLKEYVDAGIRIDSLVRSELLNTIFYVGTPLHDGAVVIQGDRIAAAGCGFRLTDSPDLLKKLGFRHRAGVGLTEDTDAVTVMVSEETGTVSVGVGGRLWRELDRETLEQVLRGLYVDAAPTVEAVFGMEDEKEEAAASTAKRERPVDQDAETQSITRPVALVGGGKTDEQTGTKRRASERIQSITEVKQQSEQRVSSGTLRAVVRPKTITAGELKAAEDPDADAKVEADGNGGGEPVEAKKAAAAKPPAAKPPPPTTRFEQSEIKAAVKKATAAKLDEATAKAVAKAGEQKDDAGAKPEAAKKGEPESKKADEKADGDEKRDEKDGKPGGKAEDEKKPDGKKPDDDGKPEPKTRKGKRRKKRKQRQAAAAASEADPSERDADGSSGTTTAVGSDDGGDPPPSTPSDGSPSPVVAMPSASSKSGGKGE